MSKSIHHYVIQVRPVHFRSRHIGFVFLSLFITSKCAELLYFPCAYSSCGRTFKSYAAFNTLIFRDHTIRKYLGASQLATPVSNTVICSVSECGRRFPHFRDLIQHAKEHIEQGKVRPSLYANCINRFKIKSTFTSHLSRKYPNFLIKSQFSCNAGTSSLHG